MEGVSSIGCMGEVDGCSLDLTVFTATMAGWIEKFDWVNGICSCVCCVRLEVVETYYLCCME